MTQIAGEEASVQPKDSRPIVYIQDAVLNETVRLLRPKNNPKNEHERVVYWAGKDFGSEWIVTTCIAPRAHTTRGSFSVSAESNARVIGLLNELSVVLLGQLHTHPGTWIEHSDGDNEGAFMPYDHFLSIIVPVYGQMGLWPLNKCGVHRFRKRAFYRLSDSEIKTEFNVLPSSCNLRKK
jgi:hypothetical protein